jgi:hypothetical protein
MVHKEASPHIASSPSFNRIPLMYQMILFVTIQIQKNPIKGRINSLENQISLVALIYISRPETYNNWTYGAAHWHYLRNEPCPQQWQSLVFHTETLSCKTSTKLRVDRCSAQAQVSQCHNGFHALLRFSLVKAKSLTTRSPFRVWT